MKEEIELLDFVKDLCDISGEIKATGTTTSFLGQHLTGTGIDPSKLVGEMLFMVEESIRASVDDTPQMKDIAVLGVFTKRDKA